MSSSTSTTLLGRGERMLIAGEIRTCLLRNSGRLSAAAVVDLLDIRPGRRVRTTSRPVGLSVTPESLTGVDCKLPTVLVLRPQRGIGTVVAHAAVTGGLILQASARAAVVRAAASGRRPWSHYAGKPGVIEVAGEFDAAQLGAGLRAETPGDGLLDLGAISQRLISEIQFRPQLDHRTTMRSSTTRLRWSATDATEAAIRLHVESGALRTVELTLPAAQLSLAERFCEDLALHDWLITTLETVVEQADQRASAGDDPMPRVSVAIDRLVNLWMPGAHVDPTLLPLWEALENRPGFSRQWNAMVARVRDQVALRTFEAMNQAREGQLG